MSRLSSLPRPLERAIATHTLLKIIAGLQNFDPDSVRRVALAAEAGAADLIDVACDPDLVRLARQVAPSVPVCVSAVEPRLFPAAIEAGAAMVEIGNYDSFYYQGRQFSATEVYELTKQARKILPQLPLSVTVPHHLTLDLQEQLAMSLVEAGADIIQTEGSTSSRAQSPGCLGLIEKAAPSLAAAHSLSRAVPVPVICASGLSDVTVPLALAAGASGVGIGAAVNRLDDSVAMVAVVRALRQATSAGVNQLECQV